MWDTFDPRYSLRARLSLFFGGLLLLALFLLEVGLRLWPQAWLWWSVGIAVLGVAATWWLAGRLAWWLMEQLLPTVVEDVQAEETLLTPEAIAQLSQSVAIIEERNRLARELHDSVTQSLYSLTLFAGAAQRLMASGRAAEAEGYVLEMKEAAQQALREMRLLVYKLRPPILQQAGLVQALQQRLRAVEARAGMKTDLLVEPTLQLAPELEEMVYQVTQEALNNALKHARATEVTVEIGRLEPGEVGLWVRDNGRGFEWETAVSGGGLGLVSMRERVQAVGGTIEYQSLPGGGTTIAVRFSEDPVAHEG